jgi:hypothetical protein
MYGIKKLFLQFPLLQNGWLIKGTFPRHILKKDNVVILVFQQLTIYIVRFEHKKELKPLCYYQGVTKRCRLPWLTNSALVYEPKCGGRVGGCGVSANEYSCTQEPK